LIERNRKAQKVADDFSQEKVDELVEAIARAIVKKDTSEEIAQTQCVVNSSG